MFWNTRYTGGVWGLDVRPAKKLGKKAENSARLPEVNKKVKPVVNKKNNPRNSNYPMFATLLIYWHHLLTVLVDKSS
jgi:hypothetical protein